MQLLQYFENVFSATYITDEGDCMCDESGYLDRTYRWVTQTCNDMVTQIGCCTDQAPVKEYCECEYTGALSMYAQCPPMIAGNESRKKKDWHSQLQRLSYVINQQWANPLIPAWKDAAGDSIQMKKLWNFFSELSFHDSKLGQHQNVLSATIRMAFFFLGILLFPWLCVLCYYLTCLFFQSVYWVNGVAGVVRKMAPGYRRETACQDVVLLILNTHGLHVRMCFWDLHEHL